MVPRLKMKVCSKGQIALPAELRKMDGIEPGREFGIKRLIRRGDQANDGVIEWLLACPWKGFFVPIESESTDAL